VEDYGIATCFNKFLEPFTVEYKCTTARVYYITECELI